MRFSWKVSLVAVLVLLVSLVVHFPVRLAWQWFAPPLKGEGISGTLWKGHIERLSWRQWQATDLRWQWSPKALLKGAWQYQVALKSPTINAQGDGDVGVDWQGGFAKNWQIYANAQGIAEQIPSPMPLKAQGTIVLKVTDYRYAAPYCAQLLATAQWQNSEVGLPLGSLSLNQVNADLSCPSGKLMGKFTQQSDALESQWQGELGKKGQYVWQGWLEPMPALSMSWRQNLSWLGRQDNEGRYQVDLKGQLP